MPHDVVVIGASSGGLEPLTKLVGVREYFDQKRDAHPEIKFIALLGADGRPLYVAGTYLEGKERAAAESAARWAYMLFRAPVMIAIHADEMLGSGA